MEITIQDKPYKVKNTVRAIFIFEQITGKIFKLEKMMDFYIFYYAMIIANNKDTNLTFDEFIDACDENLSIVQKFQEYMEQETAKNSQFKMEEDSKKN